MGIGPCSQISKCLIMMTDTQLKEYFHQIEENFNQAVISNDTDEIKKCITEDWVLVDTQGGIIPQERVFQVVEQGLLSHSTMTKEVDRKSTRLNSSHVAIS